MIDFLNEGAILLLYVVVILGHLLYRVRDYKIERLEKAVNKRDYE